MARRKKACKFGVNKRTKACLKSPRRKKAKGTAYARTVNPSQARTVRAKVPRIHKYARTRQHTPNMPQRTRLYGE